MTVKEIILTPEEAFNPQQFDSAIYKAAQILPNEQQILALKRSVDARGKQIKATFGQSGTNQKNLYSMLILLLLLVVALPDYSRLLD
jgi:hypothetical protein